ncbi:TPA: GIY-YIG nuclease family protein [Burkholderia vietnamiensis]|nr:GIY-YIG nuclease family protein [Burkholderia vietnamiensis]
MSYTPTAVRFSAPPSADSSSSNRQGKRGTVYVLTNPSIPGQVKVGATERTAEHRRNELSRATGVSTEFEIAFEATFNDVWRAERAAHEHLAPYRVANNREFFRCDAATAKRVIQQLAGIEQHDRSAIEQLKKQGVAMLFGIDGEIKDLPRALELLGQASSMGSVWASYYAGRTAHELSRDKGKSPQARSNFRKTARTFYLDAQSEVPAATGWLALLYWDNAQWVDGNREWDAFVAATAASEKPSKDCLMVLLDYAALRVNYPKQAARPWRNAAVIAHTPALIALCGNRTERDRVKRALQGESVNALPSRYDHGRNGGRSSSSNAPRADRMAGKPKALRALVAVLREPAGWVRDLCVWSPATALLLLTALGSYVLDHGWYAVLAGFGAALAALLRAAKSRRRPTWQRRTR